eukprot:jgi/Mesvir1/27204/Mv07050-RA.1
MASDGSCESDEEALFLENEEEEQRAEGVTRWRVINVASLKDAQSEDLRTVVEFLGITLHQARVLLMYFRWNKDVLFSRYVEDGPEDLFKRAGVSSCCAELSGEPSSQDGQVKCGGCLEYCGQSATTTMECGHTFCNECWSQYLVMKIREGLGRKCVCMAFRCGAVCDEDKVRRLVAPTDSDALRRFDRALLESYVEDNAQVKWCPSAPHCGHAVVVEGEVFCEPECSCGLRFCFTCGREPHSPCTCTMWEEWEAKCQGESETKNWLTANTKPCPKCHKPVEKNGGCNLVACMCGQCFCWLCGAATSREHTWTEITGHSCGRWKEDKKEESLRAATSLKRYLHYYTRWRAHLDSASKEGSRLRYAVAKRVESLSGRDLLVTDYTWLHAALAQLLESRRVLANSYVFAFYMFGRDMFGDEVTEAQNEINQNLFEDRQQQLEVTVERLAGLLEEPHEDSGDLAAVRLRVINCTDLADTQCKRMCSTVESELLGSLQKSIHHIAPYTGPRAAALMSTAAGFSDGGDSAPADEPTRCPVDGSREKRKGEHGVDIGLVDVKRGKSVDASPRKGCKGMVQGAAV